MLKTLKFKGKESDFWLTSDTHFRHDKNFIYEKRGYQSIDDHDNKIIKKWNEKINNTESIVFHLGDFIFKDSDGSYFIEYVRRLAFHKLYLLFGNHNSGQRQIYIKFLKENFPNAYHEVSGNLEYEVYPLEIKIDYREVIFLPSYVNIQINNDPVVLCHYPIMSFYGDGAGAYHLSGHSHGNNPHTSKLTGLGRRLDVGIDSFDAPINFAEVKKILAMRDIHSFDHHGTKP